MNSMVLISEEVRSDLLTRRSSGAGDRAVRASREAYAANNRVGEIRASSGDGASKRDEAECYSTELEVSDASDDWRTWMCGFETGDMVWGKVKSHPWWPGHIFNEAFASGSVRRTKREGHVLVAFFGDSSYGWFEPTELVPFEPHFVEKSRQTTSRNFLKSVEEAVDEVSRRGALGLSCRCRDPASFRPTSVPGYVAVDVIGFEPNLVYSDKEVRKAQDAFVPAEAVYSLCSLALAPGEAEHGSISTVKTMATLLAIRKATYEEFDETYAQAFGVEPVRPSRETRGATEQPPSVATRAAPLSGPLVVAEALGKRKGGVTRSAVKTSSSSSGKKNKYLFKRRDDAPPPKGPSIYVDFVRARPHPGDAPTQPSEVDNYVLQKRPPTDAPKSESAGYVPELPREVEPKPPTDEPKAKLVESVEEDRKSIEKGGVNVDVDAKDVEVKKVEGTAAAAVAPSAEQSGGDDRKEDATVATADSEMHARKYRDATVSGIVLPMAKKAPRLDVGIAPHDAAETEEKKKKKKKKKRKGMDSEGAAGVEQPKKAKLSEDLEMRWKSAARSVTFGQASAASVSQAMQNSERSAGMYSAISLPKMELTVQDLDFPQLVMDLLGLALDPFYGMERNASLLVKHVFLRFRSLVYQKSLAPPSVNEPDPETRIGKGEVAAAVQTSARVLSQAGARGRQEQVSVPKKPKPVQKAIPVRDDEMKAGRKRPPSDRQEEMLAKREKKLKRLKSLASEKKAATAVKAAVDMQKSDGQKEGDVRAALAKKNLKMDKKPEPAPQPKVPSPTYLLMKFPAGTTLPSIASQKVKFGRFGPLDISGFRVYWKSHTCKMLFKFRADAQNAYMYAANNDMFGQIKVNYSLRDVEVPVPEPAETDKLAAESRVDDAQSRLGRNDESGVDPRLSILRTLQQQQQQQGAQLKSCLKKPPGDEVGPSGSSGVKESPRVKFMLAVEEGRRETPAAVAANGGNADGRCETPVVAGNGGNGDGKGEHPAGVGNGRNGNAATPTPTPPVDTNYNVPRPVNPLPPPLSLPPPYPPNMLARPQTPLPLPQFPPPPPQQVAVAHDRILPPFSRAQSYQGQTMERTESLNIDISNQMLNLLVRCSDVVNKVNSALGYAIYHPL